MKRINVSQIVSEVATLMGESLALECHPAESPFPGLEERIRAILIPSLTELILQAPVSDLYDVAVNISGKCEIDSEGVATLPLPDDFLRLVYVKMSDWRKPVTFLSEPDSLKGKLQVSKWAGIKGNVSRPVAIRDINKNGEECLRLYSSAQSASVDLALYVARPEIGSDDTIAISKNLYQKVIPSLT